MYQTIIFPDFNKLEYLPLYQKKYIDDDKSKGSILVIKDMNQGEYLKIFDGLSQILKKEEYSLSDHFNEILLLSFNAYDNRYEQLDFNFDNYFYETDKVEIAKVLLAYLEFVEYRKERESKNLEVSKPFTLAVNFQGFNTETSNKYFTEWILEQMYKAFENGQSSPHADISGSSFSDASDRKISIEKIRAIAKESSRKPTGKLGKRPLVHFSKSLQKYLDLKTHLKTPDSKRLGNIQARFFYEVLELFGMIEDEKLNSPPEDYIASQYSKFR